MRDYSKANSSLTGEFSISSQLTDGTMNISLTSKYSISSQLTDDSMNHLQ